MKKFFIPFLLIIVLFVSGCSCSNKTKIAIDGDVSSNSHLEYQVYLADYVDETNKYIYENASTFGKITIDGSYVVDLVKGVNIESLPAEISQEMRDGLAGETIYKQTTKLTLQVSSEKANATNNDLVETVSYFYSNNLTPLYSKTISDTTYISFTENTPKFSKINSTCEIVYDTSSYKITNTIDDTSKTNEYEYEKFTALDNCSLLLAIQNIKLENAKESKRVSVVSSNYENVRDVEITYLENIETVKLINGATYNNIKSEKFNVIGESSGCFGANNGNPQVVYLSNNTMVKYVSPLCSIDAGYTPIGALQFDLI